MGGTNCKNEYMSSTSFYLRSTNTDSAKIYLKINYGRKKQLRYATGYGVKKVKNWDKGNQEVKNIIDEPKNLFINSKLSDLKNFCFDLLIDFERDNTTLTNKLLKNKIDVHTGKKKTIGLDYDNNLLSFYEWFIDYFEANPLPSTNKPLSKNTVKPYRTALKNLKEYCKIYGELDFNDIDLDFHTKFLGWLQKREYSNNYIGNQIKLLKAVMNSAFDRGLHSNLNFKKRAFHKPKEDVYSIYLNIKELQKIEKINYSKNEYRDRARDLFLIGAYTGLRVSDFNKLSKKNIVTKHKTTFFEVETQKTGKVVGIPIHPVVKGILAKRNGELPKRMPDQHINNELKKIGKKAKIKEPIEIIKTIGGIKTKTIFKKYKLICNHTGRRSFCTNAYLAEMPIFDIMAISGHTTEKVFYKYIKMTPMEQIKKLAKHPFFN